MTDRLIRIKEYEQAADEKVSIGGIKWIPKWDVCIQCDSAEEAESLRDRLAQPEQKSCWCETCRPITLGDMRMVLCPTCGNKRCPHATDHRNACTGSNEPGQPGSSYGGLAQPERIHSPAWWKHEVNNAWAEGYEKGRASLKQPEQEPVAWMHPERRTYTRAPAMSITPKEDWIPLYTAPPQREWEGLTRDERMSIINKLAGQDWVYVIDAIEAKLKEKNS